MKTALARKTDSTTTEQPTEYLAFFSHIENSLIYYKTMVKGEKNAKFGKMVIKLQDLPLGFKLKPVHPADELKFLTE